MRIRLLNSLDCLRGDAHDLGRDASFEIDAVDSKAEPCHVA